ncbi:HNH endonuclease [Actinomadura sp. LD22]|uniref:HNH endonuclease n=1 Tax=Actinomadura physcomitrii TaxID=2650748 RepID=A0A6I4M903_9ACTN|nr:HNH endonuclease [Actinomadura physcomitrii]MWA02173.1 HNH endonuclease [Actinomadura physcomitrii]
MPRKIQDNPRPRKESGRMWRSEPRPTDWNARVEFVKRRDKSCRWVDGDTVCGSTERLEVHHRGAADDHRVEMLVLLCRRHHAKVTGQQAAEARRRNRIPRNRPAERHPGLID